MSSSGDRDQQPQRHLLVVGASGLVGTAAVELFTQQPGWTVTGVSRRKPDVSDAALSNLSHVSVDLRDPSSCSQLERLTSVTHVIYAALYESPGLIPGWFDEAVMEVNRAMLDNTMRPLIACKAPLQHVTIVHGGKAYGIAHGRKDYPIPLRERDADRTHSNFYWLQESLIQQLSKAHGFHYTIFWPMIIPGAATGVNMNPVALIGVYAAIRREEGLPLTYPGPSAAAGLALTQMTDSRLLARACLHAAVTEEAWDDAFNVINGDVVEWRCIWPALARAVGMDVGGENDGEKGKDSAKGMDLAEYIGARADVWRRVVEKYQLRAPGDVRVMLGESISYGPAMWVPAPRPIILSGYKLFRTGFRELEDTEESMQFWLGMMQSRKLLPTP